MNGKAYFIYDGDNPDIHSYFTVSGVDNPEEYFEYLKFKKVSYSEYLKYIWEYRINKARNFLLTSILENGLYYDK